MLIAGTALRLERTVLTVLGTSSIAVENVSRFVLVPAFVAQVFVSRTNVVVVLGIVDENRGGEASRAGVVFFRAPFAQTADIVHPKLGDGFIPSAVGVIPTPHHLPPLPAQALSYPPD